MKKPHKTITSQNYNIRVGPFGVAKTSRKQQAIRKGGGIGGRGGGEGWDKRKNR